MVICKIAEQADRIRLMPSGLETAVRVGGGVCMHEV